MKELLQGVMMGILVALVYHIFAGIKFESERKHYQSLKNRRNRVHQNQ
jgi:hypothetical protein